MINIESLKGPVDRTAEIKAFNEKYFALVTLCEKGDEPKKGSLYGVPYTAKDNILTKNILTSACSKTLEDFIPYVDAKAIHLLKVEGAVLLGKATMDEFAFGSTGETSAGAVALNPHDTCLTTGGSSSGSAVSVACGMAAFSLGTDTSGSVRQPAAMCKIVGVKPSYGAVSNDGIIVCATSMDCVGVLASNVKDSAKVLGVISDGKICGDINSKTELTIGLPKEYFDYELMDSKVKSQVLGAVDALKNKGCKIVSVDIPTFEQHWIVYNIISSAEVSSNFGKLDGIKCGYRGDGNGWEEIFVNSRTNSFGPKTKERIIKGTYYLGEDGYDYLVDAQKLRTKIIEDYNKAFESCDVLLTPTVPTLPFRVGGARGDEDIFTVGAGLAGLPAISVPFQDTGVQIMAKRDDEATMFSAAQIVEAVAKEVQ